MFKSIDKAIFDLEKDEVVIGNVLYSTGQSLFTMNMEVGTATHIIGREYNSPVPLYEEGTADVAMFGHISSFIRHSTNSILVVDETNNMIRKVSRLPTMSSHVIGHQDTKLGNMRGGNFDESRVYSPRDIIAIGADQYAVSQPRTPYLCVIFFDSGRVIHVPIRHRRVLGLTYDSNNDVIYASTAAQLLAINPENYAVTELSTVAARNGLMSSYKDGPLRDATFNFGSSVVVLNPKTLLLTDLINHRLRAIDLEGDVSSICTGSASVPRADGSITDCTIKTPISALVYNSTTVLIGTRGGILALTGN